MQNGEHSSKSHRVHKRSLRKQSTMEGKSADDTQLVQLNVGGQLYTTTLGLLTSVHGSQLRQWFKSSTAAVNDVLPLDDSGRHFIDRDGELFRHVLDVLRQHRDSKSASKTAQIVLPENAEKKRLVKELEHYGLIDLIPAVMAAQNRKKNLKQNSLTPGVSRLTLANTESGSITIGYHGTFNFNKPNASVGDPNFRKISRLIVAGRVSLLREVFEDTLNEGRDPDRGLLEDRYTHRFYLKHSYLEQAFDCLTAAGFQLVAATSSGTNGPSHSDTKAANEEDRWMHYSEYTFIRQ